MSTGEIVFDPLIDAYQLKVGNEVESMVIFPEANDPSATISATACSEDGKDLDISSTDDGNFTIQQLPVGRTVFSIVTTAEHRDFSSTYSIAIARAASSDATLANLQLSVGDLEFDSKQTEYNVDLSEDIGDMTIFPEPSHAGASVVASLKQPDERTVRCPESENGAFEITGIEDGHFIVSLVVTAEDQVSTQNYELALVRQVRAPEREDFESQIWSLIEQDDIAGAFWMTKSLEACGVAPPVPPQLLMAAQGTRWISSHPDQYVEDLATIVSEIEPNPDDDAQVMLGLAASLQASLIAPETNLLAWLSTPKSLPEIEGVVSTVSDFASRGYALRPDYVRGDEGQQYVEDQIAEASSAAGTWWEESRKHRTKLSRANRVWQHLVSNGLVSTLLTHVVGDSRDQVETVRNILGRLANESYAIELINEADGILLGNGAPRAAIAGNARNWILSKIQDATIKASNWCDLVESQAASHLEDKDSWLQGQVSSLRARVQDESQPAYKALIDLASDSSSRPIAASAICLARSLNDLFDYLELESKLPWESLPAKPSLVQSLTLMNGRASVGKGGQEGNCSLQVAIARRLLWLRSISLADSGLPLDERQLGDLAATSAALQMNDVPSAAAMQTRLDDDDFRFLDVMASGLSQDEAATMEDKHASHLKRARETLGEHIAETREHVDQAMKEGVIEYEGEYWNSLTGRIDDIDAEHILDLRSMHDILDDIKKSVSIDLERRRKEVINDWQVTLEDSKERLEQLNAPLDEWTDQFRLASSVESPQIRVMEEYVSRIRNYRSGEDFSLVGLKEDRRNWLEEFIRFTKDNSDGDSYVSDRTSFGDLFAQLEREG